MPQDILTAIDDAVREVPDNVDDGAAVDDSVAAAAVDDVVANDPAQPPKQEPKKKPGRPPKKRPELVQAEVLGVAERPVNPDDLMEMVYCSPMIFKKILTLYKGYEVSEVEMTFEAGGVRWKAKDHLNKSSIHTTMDGRLMNYYYCRETIRICVKREYLEKILGNLDKNQYKVTFLLKENYRSTLYIIVKDCQYDKDKSYEVEVIYKAGDPVDEPKDDDTDYPIKFAFDSKHFKSEINQVRKMSQLLTIQKIGNEPLQFTFDEAKKLNYNGRYNNPDKIKLRSTVAPDDVFTVSIVIDYIKPFSNSCIGDDVFIAADKKEKMSFMTYLDKKNENSYVVCIKIFTEIKDYRRGLVL